MEILVIVIFGFIGGGFFIIALAPAFKLFNKAGRSQWLALAPGANVLTFMKIGGYPLPLMSLVSFLAFPAFAVAFDALMLQGENATVPMLALDAAVVLLVALYAFPFPLLSTGMLFTAVFFLTLAYPEPGSPALAVTVALVGLAALQAAWDFLGWRAFLKKLGRPAWQIAFPFVPVAGSLALALASLAAGPLGLPLILGVMLPSLFIGFVYYYYLGYSPKVRYRAD